MNSKQCDNKERQDWGWILAFSYLQVFQFCLPVAVFCTGLGGYFDLTSNFFLSFTHVSCFTQVDYGFIWVSFQASRKRFRNWQKGIWLTIINEILKLLPHLGPFCQINNLFKFFFGLSKSSNSKMIHLN